MSTVHPLESGYLWDGTKCLSWRDFRLIESQIRGVEKTETTVGVGFTKVSNKRESTALSMKVMLLALLESCQKKSLYRGSTITGNPVVFTE